MNEVSAQDMAVRKLRIKRDKVVRDRLLYLHNNVQITKEQFDQLLALPPPDGE